MHATHELFYVIDNCRLQKSCFMLSCELVGKYEPLELVKLETILLEYPITYHQMGLRPRMRCTCLEIVGLCSPIVRIWMLEKFNNDE